MNLAYLEKCSGDSLEVSKLQGNGMALGMVPSELFDEIIEDQSCTFEQGDMLVFYTDGVTESQSQSNEEFGLDRLCRTLRKCKGEKSFIVQSIFNEGLKRILF